MFVIEIELTKTDFKVLINASTAPWFTTVAVLFVIISKSNHDGPINLLQQTGTQVTMMVPPTSAVAPSKEGGREKLKYSTIEKSEEMNIKN